MREGLIGREIARDGGETGTISFRWDFYNLHCGIDSCLGHDYPGDVVNVVYDFR